MSQAELQRRGFADEVYTAGVGIKTLVVRVTDPTTGWYESEVVPVGGSIAKITTDLAKTLSKRLDGR